MGVFKLDGDVFSHIKQDIIKVGNKLEFKAINGDMSDFHIDDVRAKYKVISSIVFYKIKGIFCFLLSKIIIF